MTISNYLVSKSCYIEREGPVKYLEGSVVILYSEGSRFVH